MSESLIPARVVLPGRILERELEARGWTQRDLAAIMRRPPQAINEIVKGAKQIIPETALELAEAFETSPELWMNLEANYRLHLARQEKKEKEISRRSRLYGLAPIAEMIKRGWINDAESLDQLEAEVCDFYGISSPEETPKPTANFRHAQQRGPEINAQIAWIKRVEYLAKAQDAGRFDRARLRKALPGILACAAQAEDVARVPSILLSLGVRFIIVPHLPKTYIDGAALSFDGRPIIALSLRYDRIDTFWFTLMHELAHIVMGHREAHLDNFDDSDTETDAAEVEANQVAYNWLIEPEALKSFVKETRPFFSRSKIERFAQSQGRHPGIALGRLQYEKIVEYKHLRSLLVKVSPFLGDWIDVPTPQRVHAG